MLTYEGCDLLDISGPAEVFKFAQVQLREEGCTDFSIPDPLYFSPDGGLVTTAQGLQLLTLPLEELRHHQIHTLIAVGSFQANDSSDPRLADAIRESIGTIPRIGSVCTGAFILARAGLLDGRRATTHFLDCDELKQKFPKVEADPSCIFTEDEGIWTSAGVTAGIDMALAMIEQDFGPELALKVAHRLCVFLKRPAGQPQISVALQSQNAVGPMANLLRWISDNLDADLRAEVLAERSNMSLRNFYRAFTEATGHSPGDWVEASRMEVAKRLLEQTDQNADQIAYKAGFTSYERMRRTFIRKVGASPLAYRTRNTRQTDVEPRLLSA
ncbi:MAG: helix-turn-helix domain-containing protein [Verrucomicrobiae bacterium]|nr:helix-turn-helix domain-containing protein [Verrucomicrobiae bacterium]